MVVVHAGGAGRFLTSLISAAPDRLGKNGVGEVMASTWLAGVPWERIREMRAPYVTEGAARVKVCEDCVILVDMADHRFIFPLV